MGHREALNYALGNKRKIDNARLDSNEAFAKEYDLIVQWDMGGKPKEYGGRGEYSVCYLSTMHDPSVGIHGQQLSPAFRTITQLSNWVTKHRKELEKLVQAETYDHAWTREAEKLRRKR